LPIKKKVPAGTGLSVAVQHEGLGKKLLQKAEQIAQKKGFKQLWVISGVGVRQYYRKLGYQLKETYMVKTLS
jgi:elongator complex protein 3